MCRNSIVRHIVSVLEDRTATIEIVQACFLQHFPSSFPLPVAFRISYPLLATSLSAAEKEVINIAGDFSFLAIERGQNFAHEWAGSCPNPQSQNGSLRRPPIYGRRKFRRTCSRLEWSSSGYGQYFRSRVTYYRTGRTLCEFR